MPGAPQPSSSPVRARFGPSLPELLRRRLGVRERTTLIAAGALAVLLVAGAYAVVRLRAPEQLVHRGEPVFNVLHREGTVSPVEPRRGELMRLRASRRGLALSVSVRPLRLPPYGGNVARGLLPLHVERHKAALRTLLPGFTLRDEGRANVSGAPGYQLRYRSGTRGRRILWRDTFVVPEERGAREGVLLTMRIDSRDGRLDDADRALVRRMRAAYSSFAFGTDRSR